MQPCDHCSRTGEAKLCVRYMARKCGRPRAEVNVLGTVRLLRLNDKEKRLLALFLSPDGLRVVLAQPELFISGFGMDGGNNYFFLSFPSDAAPLVDALARHEKDACAMFTDARVEVAVFDGKCDEFLNHEEYVGKKYAQVIDFGAPGSASHLRACLLAIGDKLMAARCPLIFSFDLSVEASFLLTQGRCMCCVRSIVCFDELGCARLMIIKVLADSILELNAPEVKNGGFAEDAEDFGLMDYYEWVDDVPALSPSEFDL